MRLDILWMCANCPNGVSDTDESKEPCKSCLEELRKIEKERDFAINHCCRSLLYFIKQSRKELIEKKALTEKFINSVQYDLKDVYCCYKTDSLHYDCNNLKEGNDHCGLDKREFDKPIFPKHFCPLKKILVDFNIYH